MNHVRLRISRNDHCALIAGSIDDGGLGIAIIAARKLASNDRVTKRTTSLNPIAQLTEVHLMGTSLDAQKEKVCGMIFLLIIFFKGIAIT